MDPYASRASDRNDSYLVDDDMSDINRHPALHARNIEELQKLKGVMQPHQHRPHQPRTRGRSILLAAKQKYPIRSQIMPLDGQAVPPDITTMTNGCFDLTDMETSQMESQSFFATEQPSKGSTEVIGHQVSGMDSILYESYENTSKRKSSVDRSVSLDSMIEGKENNANVPTIGTNESFLEKYCRDGDSNYNANEMSDDASGIYPLLESSGEEVLVNCALSRMNCSMYGSQMETNASAGGQTLEMCTLMACNHQRTNATIVEASSENILIRCEEDASVCDNLLIGSHNSDATAGDDTLLASSKSDMETNRVTAKVDTLLEGSKTEIASYCNAAVVDTLFEGSKTEIESKSDDTVRFDALMVGNKNEIKSNSDTFQVYIPLKGNNTEIGNTAWVDTQLEGSNMKIESSSVSIARVDDQMVDSHQGSEGNFEETSRAFNLVKESQKELEGDSGETSRVGDLVEDSQRELEGNSQEISRVNDLVDDIQKGLEGNIHETSRADLVEDAQKKMEGKTDEPFYHEFTMDNNLKELTVNGDDPFQVPSSMEGSQKNIEILFHMVSSKTLISQPIIEESIMESSNNDENKLEHRANNVVEETLIDQTVSDQKTEKEEFSALGAAAAAAISHIELNSHFYSSGKVYAVCEESDSFEIEDCRNGNLPHTKRTTSTPTARLRRNASKEISIPSECLGFCYKRHAKKRVLLLSLKPSGQITLKGMAYVKCLLGSVNILGYTLKQGEKMPVFAPYPEVSLLVQGPDAETMTSDPGREIDERHWIHFFSKQAKQKQQSEPDMESSDSCTVDENFWTKWMTATGEEYNNAAEYWWKQLNLVMGERAVVLEVSQFPVSSLDRVHRVCSGVNQLSPHHFMAVALHSPSRPRPRAFLTVTGSGLKKKQRFKIPLYLPFSWRQVVSSVCADHSQQSRGPNQSGVRVMVIGGQGVGRSTLTRFLVNALLSSSPSDDRGLAFSSTKRASVCVLDLDPRHSEQSLPGTVSCARYIAPALGHAYVYGVAHALRRKTSTVPEWRGSRYSDFNKLNFDENPLELPEIIKEFLIGREDLTEVAEEYFAATAVLVDAHRSQCGGDPLVVNCTSADNYIDFRIILEVMRLVNPSHVVHIQGKINQKTETSPFNCDRANEELGRRGRYHCDVTGKYTSDTDPDRILPITENLTYVYARIPSVVKSMDVYKMPDIHKRDNVIASYFSSLWPHFSPAVESASLQRSVISSCHNFALHVRHGGVHYSQLLNSINCAGLVSLCYIDPKHIKKFAGKNYSIVDTQPRGSRISSNTATDSDFSALTGRPQKRLKLSPTTLSLLPFNGDCLLRVHGWAIVKGVDPVDKNIHLLIPGCASVLTKINCIVQSNVQLPASFDWLLYKGYQSRPYETFVEQGPRNTKVKQRTNKKH